MYEAILDTHKENRLPTQDEAKFLAARYRAHNRSLMTDDEVLDFIDQLDYTYPNWEDNPARARRAMALEHMRSGLLDLRCAGPK